MKPRNASKYLEVTSHNEKNIVYRINIYINFFTKYEIYTSSFAGGPLLRRW